MSYDTFTPEELAEGIYRLLNQTIFWVDIHGTTYPLRDMTYRHRDNAISFLRKRALRLRHRYEWGEVLCVPTHLDEKMDEWGIKWTFENWPEDHDLTTPEGRGNARMDALDWLNRTPLLVEMERLQMEVLR